ncbi:hypothetical protein JOM56_011576 [Amanita muscaria]
MGLYLKGLLWFLIFALSALLTPHCAQPADAAKEMQQHLVSKHKIPLLGVTRHGCFRLKQRLESAQISAPVMDRVHRACESGLGPLGVRCVAGGPDQRGHASQGMRGLVKCRVTVKISRVKTPGEPMKTPGNPDNEVLAPQKGAFLCSRMIKECKPMMIGRCGVWARMIYGKNTCPPFSRHDWDPPHPMIHGIDLHPAHNFEMVSRMRCFFGDVKDQVHLSLQVCNSGKPMVGISFNGNRSYLQEGTILSVSLVNQ